MLMLLLIIMAAVFVALGVFDVVSTNMVLARGGNESNPLMTFCMTKLGPDRWWIPKMTITLTAALACIFVPWGWLFLLIMIAIQAWVDYRNYRVYRQVSGR